MSNGVKLWTLQIHCYRSTIDLSVQACSSSRIKVSVENLMLIATQSLLQQARKCENITWTCAPTATRAALTARLMAPCFLKERMPIHFRRLCRLCSLAWRRVPPITSPLFFDRERDIATTLVAIREVARYDLKTFEARIAGVVILSRKLYQHLTIGRVTRNGIYMSA